MNRTVVSLTALAFASLASGAYAQIPAKYNLISLGTTDVKSINNQGFVCGNTVIPGTTLKTGYSWSNGVLSILKVANQKESYLTDTKFDINNNLISVGNVIAVNSYDPQAILVKDGVVTFLGTLGGRQSLAYSVNNTGNVAGYSYGTTGSHKAFFYKAGVMYNLGTLGGDASIATSINNKNQIVGYSQIVPRSSKTQAFLYSDGKMQALGTLGGPNSYAYAINDSGVVVGQSTRLNGSRVGFIRIGSTMTAIPTLGGTYGVAYSINSGDMVVGTATTSLGQARAFVHHKGETINLNTRLQNSGGWVLISANQINDRGQIVAVGTLNGLTRAFVLDPVVP